VGANHLNYCRNMVAQFTTLRGVPQTDNEGFHFRRAWAVALAGRSQKFMLPDSGELLDDIEFRALDETRPLRLPFPRIALEYHTAGNVLAGDVVSTKRIVFAYERKDGIGLLVVGWLDLKGFWFPFPEFVLPSVGYLDRSRPNRRGRPSVMLSLPDGYADDVGCVIAKDAGVLLGFLNALQCRNVGTYRSPPSGAHPGRSALPFDSYHILTIDAPASSASTGVSMGARRAPREHLRRGHIRVYESGLKLWINATVVAGGRGAGVVTKDYRVPEER